MAMAISPCGGVRRGRTCEFNVLQLRTIGGVLIPMEHPHGPGCQRDVALADTFPAEADVVKVDDQLAALSLVLIRPEGSWKSKGWSQYKLQCCCWTATLNSSDEARIVEPSKAELAKPQTSSFSGVEG